MELTGKKVLVFGSGISGIGAAKLLLSVGAVPVIYDGNENVEIKEIQRKTGSEIEVWKGAWKNSYCQQLDLVVMSPGVPMDIAPVLEMKEAKIPIWGEIELAYSMGKGDVLAITGTNGKTTTTALLGKIMEDYYDSVFVVGNIGTPYTSVVPAMKEESVTVAEISSFQLESIQDFRPCVSAILNITEDHLNRHHTMEEYIRVKELITKNQTKDDLCVLNFEDEVLQKFGKGLHTKVIFFSSARRLERGIFLQEDEIRMNLEGEETTIVNVADLKLLGIHNFENVMAAVAMAYGYGVPMESIKKTICEFTSVEHRIEYVTEKNGVTYYNDSKGTNPDAAIKGIQAMNRPTYLIGGGYDKDSEYEEWIRAFDGKVRKLVLIGQTREKIQEAAHRCGFMDTVLADDLEEAVTLCAKWAQPGEAVLLSPACASWGQFENYEIRGKMFKEYVSKL